MRPKSSQHYSPTHKYIRIHPFIHIWSLSHTSSEAHIHEQSSRCLFYLLTTTTSTIWRRLRRRRLHIYQFFLVKVVKQPFLMYIFTHSHTQNTKHFFYVIGPREKKFVNACNVCGAAAAVQRTRIHTHTRSKSHSHNARGESTTPPICAKHSRLLVSGGLGVTSEKKDHKQIIMYARAHCCWPSDPSIHNMRGSASKGRNVQV